MPFSDPPTPEDQILPIEDFKKLTLHAMLQKLPIVNLTGSISMKMQMPRIHCVDGTSLSVQASDGHYCSPRNNSGPYSCVEVGFIDTDVPPSWIEYAEDPENPKGTIFSYIPIELVCFYIAGHGGIDLDKTFKDFTYEFPR